MNASTLTNTSNALRFITCGSVDDGKSTLIGRLLVDTKAVLQDHFGWRATRWRNRFGVAHRRIERRARTRHHH
jgi:sulfate adenylyltransferase subunit 1 (EFTu-like GTPase family)